MKTTLGVHGTSNGSAIDSTPRSCRTLAGLVLFTAGGPASAQLSTAAVTGFVRDSSSAVVIGATVVLRNVDTSVELQSQSNNAGTYSFLNVPPGRYTLKA